MLSITVHRSSIKRKWLMKWAMSIQAGAFTREQRSPVFLLHRTIRRCDAESRRRKTGAMTIPSDACGIEKWSDFFPVCGKIVVKRKITAKLAVIFLKNGGPNRDRTDDLTDAKEQMCIVCAWIWLFPKVSANNYFAFRPLLTTCFHTFRGPLWYVLWSSNEPRQDIPARLEWYLCLDGTSEWPIRQRFLRQSNAGNAMLNQRIR